MIASFTAGDSGCARSTPVIFTPPAGDSRSLKSSVPAKAGTHRSVTPDARVGAPKSMLLVSSREAEGWVPAFAGTPASEEYIDSPLGQAEDAFADDVALDLAGAAGDCVLPGAEHPLGPARRIGHRFRLGLQCRVGAEQRTGKIRDPPRQFRPEQFQDRAFGA